MFYLLAAIDGHAKNFSIFLTPDGYKLTPIYDVMSAIPYFKHAYHKIKLAMSVGDRHHYRITEIHPRHFYQTGQKAGLHKQDIDNIFSNLVVQIDNAIATVAMQAADAGMPGSTSEPILAEVSMRAKKLR